MTFSGQLCERLHRRRIAGSGFVPGFAREEADLAFTARWTNQPGQGSRLTKARLPQHRLPLRAFKQRMVRAQVSIGEAPPAAGQTEDRFRPQLRSGDVNEQQTAARREQFVNVPQRHAHVADGMEHIGAEDEIERAGLEALFGARLFEIEDLELHLRKGRQLLHRAGEECRRHVTERIGVQAALEQRQHVRRQSTRAGANLQDAQSAALGQMAGGFLHRLAIAASQWLVKSPSP